MSKFASVEVGSFTYAAAPVMFSNSEPDFDNCRFVVVDLRKYGADTLAISLCQDKTMVGESENQETYPAYGNLLAFGAADDKKVIRVTIA